MHLGSEKNYGSFLTGAGIAGLASPEISPSENFLNKTSRRWVIGYGGINMLGSAKVLSEILSISERRVNQIATEGEVFQRDTEGKFNIPLCVRQYYKDKFDSDGEDEAKKLKWEAELKKLQAEAAELKNEIARGEYIEKDEITAELQRFFVVLKRSMLGYSRRIAVEISPYVEPLVARRIEKMVQELTLDALEQISIDGVYEPSAKKKKTTTA